MPAANVAEDRRALELREQLGRGARIVTGSQILADRTDSPIYLPGDPRLIGVKGQRRAPLRVVRSGAADDVLT